VPRKKKRRRICVVWNSSDIIDCRRRRRGELWELLGSTYCEEEHQNTIQKLKKEDTERIFQSDFFLSWYIAWLFGEDEEENGSEEEEEDNNNNNIDDNNIDDDEKETKITEGTGME